MQHHKRHKHDIVIVIALAAFGLSLYLAITKYLGYAVPCDITKGCEVVLSSKYSELFGLPLAVWGVVFYTSVVVSALLANHYVVFKRILTAILSLGGVAAIVFLSIQFFLLHKVCQYCLITDAIAIILLLWDLNIEHYEL